MATVRIDKFGGIAPRTHPALLPDGMAVEALNCRLKTGKLVPLREPREYSGDALTLLEGGISNPGEARSMHAWRRVAGGFDFLCFPGVTWAAPGSAVAADPLTRLLVSGDRTGGGSPSQPCVYWRDASTGAARSRSLVMAAPGRPKAKRVDTSALSGPVRYTRFFVTWVDSELGHESPVSPPSLCDNGGGYEDEELEYNDGDEVLVELTGDMPAGADLVRVYKVVAGAQDGRVQFVKEIGAAAAWQSGVSVGVRDEDAGEAVPEIEAPPADLTCVRWVPGGFWCGFSPSSPRTVCFSEVGMPYSWPEAYRYDVEDRVAALAATSNTVFALTDGWPYAITGTAPEGMTVSRMAGPAACVSARSVCVFRDAVFFASNEGLAAAYNGADSGTTCRVLTDKVWTRDQWQALSPRSCMAGARDGALMLFMDGGSYTVDLGEDFSAMVSRNDESADCLCEDAAEDRLYFIRRG